MSILATRMAFGKRLVELAAEHEFLVCSADTKACGIERLGEQYPGRSFSIGIAEQNLINTAAGLAACGNKVFAATFAVFASMRCCEQIRTYVCYPQLNVTVVGTHTGLQVGQDGATHAAVEDVSIMRTLPNMTVIQPSDMVSATAAADAAVNFTGPLYVRLHRNPSPLIFEDPYHFEIGKAVPVRKYGKDAAILASGILLSKAVEAADILRGEGIYTQVIEHHTIKPMDQASVLESAGECGCIVTVEDHSCYGGLASAVAEILAKNRPCPMECIAIPDVFGQSGDAEALYQDCGMSTADIVAAVRRAVERK